MASPGITMALQSTSSSGGHLILRTPVSRSIRIPTRQPLLSRLAPVRVLQFVRAGNKMERRKIKIAMV